MNGCFELDTRTGDLRKLCFSQGTPISSTKTLTSRYN